MVEAYVFGLNEIKYDNEKGYVVAQVRIEPEHAELIHIGQCELSMTKTGNQLFADRLRSIQESEEIPNKRPPGKIIEIGGKEKKKNKEILKYKRNWELKNNERGN